MSLLTLSEDFEIPFRGEDQVAHYVSWYSWKTKNLLYFLDKRTIRLVSGARMAFSSPKSQWLQAFEKPFGTSVGHHQNNLHERVVS